MHHRFLVAASAFLLAVGGCSDSVSPAKPEPVLLKDMVVSSLPSPYYHFDYDTTGRPLSASFAAGFANYDIVYDGDRIKELTGGSPGSQNHIQYTYDAQGRVGVVAYVDAAGRIFAQLTLWYDGARLTKLERFVGVTGGYILDKTTTFAYFDDGNVHTITVHRPAIDGVQTDNTTELRFEQYDKGINVDDFGLIHDDFFDQLVLLPAVRLQKNNPAREILTGSSTDYTADYAYAYDERGRPLAKTGVLTLVNGTSGGSVFPIRTDYTYYK